MPTINKSMALKMGIPSHTLQTVLLPKDWSIEKSKKWLADAHMVNSYYRDTEHWRRWMQVFPIHGATYASKHSGPAIMVYQTY